MSGATNSDSEANIPHSSGSGTRKDSRRNDCRRQVCEDFGKAFRSEEFSDFKIRCGGQIFPCHKLVLSARSPVFKAMFQSNMREASINEVTINDFQPRVLDNMLQFIYTGTFESGYITANIAFDLLGAANKYQLEQLKNICEDKLCESLDIGNSMEYLVVSDMQGADKLRQMSLDFIVKNMDLIVDTPVYRNWMDSHKHLVLEITRMLIQKAGTKRTRVDSEIERDSMSSPSFIPSPQTFPSTP